MSTEEEKVVVETVQGDDDDKGAVVQPKIDSSEPTTSTTTKENQTQPSASSTSSSPEEIKQLGNDAYNAGDYGKAIELYTRAIELQQEQQQQDGTTNDLRYIYHSNRAAAYLKTGDYAKALADAEVSLQLSKGTFLKAHVRKASSLLALHRYKEAKECLREGLSRFPDDPILLKHLAAVDKERKLGQEKARNSIVMTQSAQQKKTAAADTMSDFVTMAKLNVELQIMALQAQLKLLNSLGEMSDDDKRNLLFDLLDKDKSGTINARELADAIRKRNQGMSFAEGLDRAIQMVAIFDQDGDAKLNRQEFNTLVDAMLEENGGTFHQLSEFLILQFLFSQEGNNPIEELAAELAATEIDAAVKEASQFFKAATDDRMLALFRLFDMDGDGTVSFREIALGLFKLSNTTMEDSARSAIELLIMVEKEDSRELDFEQFTRLILNFCAAGGMQFDEVADGLTLLMCRPTVVTEEDLVQLLVADEMYDRAKDFAEAKRDMVDVMDALSYSKMHKLFDLWDENHDGALDYAELLKGMRKYQQAMDIDESVQRAAIAMLAFDQDGNQKLDKEEFALALAKFAQSLEVDLKEMIDFLVIVSVLSDNDPMESAYISAIAPQATAEIKFLQALEADGLIIEVE